MDNNAVDGLLSINKILILHLNMVIFNFYSMNFILIDILYVHIVSKLLISYN